LRKARKTIIITLLSILLLASMGPFYLAYSRRTLMITIDANDQEFGIVSPGYGSWPVFVCKDITFTIIPKAGYHIESLEVDGVLTTDFADIYGATDYTFTKVKDDHLLNVTFGKNAEVLLPGNEEATINVLTAPPDLLPGFEFIVGLGAVAPFFEITVEGGLSGGIATVTIHYDDTGLSDEQEANLRLYIGDAVDFNNDGTVNGNDVAMIQAAEKSGEVDPMYDLNHDGVVGVIDEKIVKEYANSGVIVNPGNDDAGEFRIPWVDITVQVYPDENLIVGQSWHLSLFGVR
jgi:hypothetical protein